MGAKDIMLAIHILCGFIALVTMVMAYVTKKGPTFHAKLGRVYGLAMVGVGLTAIILFFLGASTFLLLIAFFSLYLVLVGWRFASNRKGEVSQVDKMLIQFGGFGGIALLGMAVFIATSGSAPFGQSKSLQQFLPHLSNQFGISISQRTLQVEGSNPRGKRGSSPRYLHGRRNDFNGYSIYDNGVWKYGFHLVGSYCNWHTIANLESVGRQQRYDCKINY